MLYKLNKNETLEGTEEEIIEALLAEHRDHLYTRTKVLLVDPDSGVETCYFKTKTRYCPDCGVIHGARIQLIPKLFSSFKTYFQPKACSICVAGVLPAEKDWMKEFIGDDHEKVASTKG